MRAYDKLSASFVKGLKRPGKFYDGGGLMLQATKADDNGGIAKSWLFRFQIDHRERQMGLGPTRDVTLAEAREKAAACRKLVAAGIDPLAARNAARAEELRRATFRQCLDGFLASHGDKWRAKHLNQWRNSMRTYAKVLDGIAVADIDVGMVLRVIEPDWKRAPQTMDRVRRRIGEVLGWAEVRGFRPTGPLPTRWKDHLDKLLCHPRALAPVVHHAAPAYDVVPGLFARLIASDAIPELSLAFTALTAVRSVEARGARWDEIDFKGRMWIIPPSRMKRRREHRVPLSPEALALIARLPRKSEYLFTVNGNGKPIVAMSLRKALARHAGEGLTVHGLRSSFRTWADERTNFPREIKEVALAHSIGSNETEEAYLRTDLVEKRRRLMQQWATFLAAATAEAARIVQLRQGQRHG